MESCVRRQYHEREIERQAKEKMFELRWRELAQLGRYKPGIGKKTDGGAFGENPSVCQRHMMMIMHNTTLNFDLSDFQNQNQ